MESNSKAVTKVDFSEVARRWDQILEEYRTWTPSEMEEIYPGVTKAINSLGLHLQSTLPKRKVDTEVGHDVMDGCCKLQLKDHPTEAPSRMKKISRGVTKLLNHWVMQQILDYSWLIIPTFAIFSFGALCMYSANSNLLSGYTWTRYAMIVSLCDFSPSFIPQRNASEQAGSTLIGKFFYARMNEDHVNSDEVCGITITLTSNPRATRCTMIFTPIKINISKSGTDGTGEKDSVDEKYEFVMLPDVNERSYNRSSPLYDRWADLTLTTSYNKFSTEWLKGMKLGGATYDSLLLTMQNGPETLVIDLNHGLIMSTKQQGHASKALKVLAFVGKSLVVEESVKKVLSQAMLNFCGQVQTTSNNASVTLELACDGVTGLPPGVQCYTHENDDGCTWGYSQRSALVPGDGQG